MINNTKQTILLVDDEKSIRDTLKIVFEDAGFIVITAADAKEALSHIGNSVIDVMITDLKMPGMDGIELMEKTIAIDQSIQVIFISAYSDIKAAVQAIKKGAFDYVQKSFTAEEILIIINKAIERKQLIEENQYLKEQLNKNYEYYGVVGKSKKMQLLFSVISRIAQSKATVLLSGESGVGKEVFAHLIHKKSKRANNNFVVINCGAIPDNLIESELFGFEKGAFTGADKLKIGKFEQADKGTVFLDEVGELPMNLQVKFLRVLQEKQLERVGSVSSIDVDIRVVAATNKNLLEEVKKGNFREDLFYRLNVINIEIPPLRERRADIPLLAEKFLQQFSTEYNKKLKYIDIETINLLIQNIWKGNIRELKNVIERAVAISDNDEKILTLKHLTPEISGVDNGEVSSNKLMTLKEFEKIMIVNTLKQVENNKSKAADILGIKRQTLYNKIKEYEIEN